MYKQAYNLHPGLGPKQSLHSETPSEVLFRPAQPCSVGFISVHHGHFGVKKNSKQRGPWGHLCDKEGPPPLRLASWMLGSNQLWQWNSNQRRLPTYDACGKTVTKDSSFTLSPLREHCESIHALTVKRNYSPLHALTVKIHVSQQRLKAPGCEKELAI